MFRSYTVSSCTVVQASLIFLSKRYSVDRDERGQTKNNSHAEAKVRKARLADVEAINTSKDDGESREKSVKHRKVEANIQRKESDDGFGNEHVQWSKQSHSQEELESIEPSRPGGIWWANTQAFGASL